MRQQSAPQLHYHHQQQPASDPLDQQLQARFQNLTMNTSTSRDPAPIHEAQQTYQQSHQQSHQQSRQYTRPAKTNKTPPPMSRGGSLTHMLLKEQHEEAKRKAEMDRCKKSLETGGTFVPTPMKRSDSALFDNLQNGLDMAERAEAEDQNQNFPSALALYQDALEYFLKALQHETNPQMQTPIKEKIDTYMTRAEQIKVALKGGGSLTALSRSAGSNATAPARRTAPPRVEVSAAASAYVEGAVSKAEEALAADRHGDYAEAYALYEEAVAQFSAALKIERNSAVRGMITSKMVDYNRRIEHLKIHKGVGDPTIGGVNAHVPFGRKPQEPKKKKGKKGGLFGRRKG
eukprot:TRINITY_DN18347_c0_g1_i1.p1 TRINITY_DN18347_c0_g1~~TRINITY_DN18347_c0_g1_i1.p1  ORF type:complete len:404 (+),score=82.62 TRINITY_DN18347_c0_g1_i1:175-1212(+)